MASEVQGKKNLTQIVIGLAVVALFAIAYWYWQSQQNVASVVEPPAAPPIENAGLGSELIEKAQNPIKGQLPETVAPVPNPLQGIYKNPFE